MSKETLDEIVDVITSPSELDQASIVSMIKSLYPSSQVSVESTLKVVGALGHGQSRASFTTQAWLLKWLIMVYDCLEDPKVLSQAYSFLFNLLGTIAIRYVGPFEIKHRLINLQAASMSPTVFDHSP